MSLARKILIIWFLVFTLSLISLLVFPNKGSDLAEQANQGLMMLGGILSFFLYKSDPSRNNKPIFLNLTFFFGISILFHLYFFLGFSLMQGVAYASFYFYQYVQGTLFLFLLAFSVIYIVFDSLFHDFRIYQKYVLTLLVVGGVFTYYYYPLLENPNYLYTTPEVVDYKIISNAVRSLEKASNLNPSVDEIADATKLSAWNNGKAVGILFDTEKPARIRELLPYLHGKNYATLMFRPVFFRTIYMCVFTIVFIFLYFGYQYKKDPPQGAYIEKIVFLFLPYCSLEILHAFAFAQAVEFDSYLEIYEIGKYLTILITLMFVVFFSLRLRFITSAQGEFYEQELVSDSQHISRWRDGIDNLVVRHFLNPKTLHGRLLAPRAPRAET